MIYAIVGIIALALIVMFLLGYMHGRHEARSEQGLCGRKGWFDL